MSPPSPATAGRTRVSSSSLIWATISCVLGGDIFLGRASALALDHRAAGDEVLHDGAEHLRLQRLPGGVVGLGHGDEVAAEEDPRDAREREQRGGQRAARGRVGEAKSAVPAPIT